MINVDISNFGFTAHDLQHDVNIQNALANTTSHAIIDSSAGNIVSRAFAVKFINFSVETRGLVPVMKIDMSMCAWATYDLDYLEVVVANAGEQIAESLSNRWSAQHLSGDEAEAKVYLSSENPTTTGMIFENVDIL